MYAPPIVRVYRNLTKRCYSVQAKVGGNWRVNGRLDGVYLTNASFIVSEAGRQRVLRERKKYVHAFVKGEYRGASFAAAEDLCLAYKDITRVSYNPYAGGSFVDGASRPVATAARVWLLPQGVYVSGITYAVDR